METIEQTTKIQKLIDKHFKRNSYKRESDASIYFKNGFKYSAFIEFNEVKPILGIFTLHLFSRMFRKYLQGYRGIIVFTE